MPWDWLLLALITFLSATLQSAIGFGFGLIAVPIFLLILNSAHAIQMVMIIILCVSLVDWYKLKGKSAPTLLWCLNIGMLFGFPIGLYIFQQVDLNTLKLIIAVVIMLFSGLLFYRQFKSQNIKSVPVDEIKHWKTTVSGFLSGIMTSSLAMPGPIVMIYLVQQGLDKTLIRATILTFFVTAYSGAILLQSLMVGISASTWTSSLALVPPALIGVFVGHKIADKINQQLFRTIVLTLLILMALVMLIQLI